MGFLGHTLGCMPGFSRLSNKFKDLTKKKKISSTCPTGNSMAVLFLPTVVDYIPGRYIYFYIGILLISKYAVFKFYCDIIILYMLVSAERRVRFKILNPAWKISVQAGGPWQVLAPYWKQV